MPTLEEAQRCPRCDTPGLSSPGRAAPGGSKVFTYTCMNARCRWHQTSWLVQVLSNGEIPERQAGPKEYAPLTEGEKSMARAILEENEAAMRRGEARR